jgi:hypothetical protein
MTVHVRDFFLWPFFALLAGAVLGGLGTRWWEQRRRRALLVKQVKDAYAVYEAATKNRPTSDRPPPLHPGPATRRDDLIKEIERSESDEKYNAQVDAVAAYEAELRRWLRLAKAADALEVLAQELPIGAGEIKVDIDAVLAWLELKPDDSGEGDRLADQAERLTEIGNVFVPVWQLWQQKGRPESLNPRGAYSARAFNSKSRSLEVRRDLEVLRNRLRRYQPTEAGLFLFEGLPTAMRRQLEFALQAPPPQLRLWKPFDELEPKAIEHRVRLFDWGVGLASLLVTLLAFLLTKYGQDYGSLSDYAQAFTAGFLGQVAGATIAWNLLPPFRSYRATKTTAAPEPAKA